MNRSDVELAQKKAIGFIWLVAVCFFNTVPLFIISLLANLSAVCTIFQVPGLALLTHSRSAVDDCICPVPSIMVKCITPYVLFRLWCSASSCIRHLRVLPAHCYALALTVHGCTHAILSRSCRCCPLLLIPGHLAIGDLHIDRRCPQ
jgi:hypothetical protein